jgi:formylglycine-generating enzyme required for sulfatase activity
MDKRRISAMVIGTVLWIGAANLGAPAGAGVQAEAAAPAGARVRTKAPAPAGTPASNGAGEDGPSLRSLRLSGPQGVATEIAGGLLSDGSRFDLPAAWPLFTLLVDGAKKPSTALPSGLSLSVSADSAFRPGAKLNIVFRNVSGAKIKLENLVPLGEGGDRTYITAGLPNAPPHQLSRTQIFRPGSKPVGVVLPDNAWHLGFASVDAPGGLTLTALARRVKSEKVALSRWAAILEPGGSLEYALYAEAHRGGWRRGLEIMFRERFLYDLARFDDTLFRRPDLAWIRRAYIMLLQFAWDHSYYDNAAGRTAYDETLTAWDKLLGPVDIYTLWPTWPRLGLDERNQWDMYRDLPGGLAELRRQADLAHQRGKKYFISYNPWDESTRREDHLAGMEAMIRTVGADGVVLDTRGDSSREFQAAADRARPGVIMYSEGMAVPKDMPGIVAGRVHDALFMPPPLNLNKFMKPDFAIFRVLQLGEGEFHREAAVAFFNGYGSEINTMRPGRPDWIEDNLRYLGRTTKVLRENSSAFLDPAWQPLVPVLEDGLWANRWSAEGKTVYTVFNLRPEGFRGPFIEAPVPAGSHLVSLWNHEELKPTERGGRTYAPVDVAAFDAARLGTRLEGSIDCVAVLPELLSVALDGEILSVAALCAPAGSRIVVTAGDPSYGAHSETYGTGARTIALHEPFGFRDEKFGVQLFDGGGELLDERVVRIARGIPRLVSKVERTPLTPTAPDGMVEIPAGTFGFKTAGNPDDANPVIPYPDTMKARTIRMPRFFMDRGPVTNAQFAAFLKATGYAPGDTANYLKHWTAGRPPAGLENHPVVWIDLQDARAYARWADKRLPTEAEWQYAAQGTDGRAYPWGPKMEAGRCNNKLNHTTPVDAFPGGASPFGVLDMVGNVWQIIDDIYDNGAYTYAIIRGGSFYAPEKSEWYVKSGPLAADRVQILLLIASGLDRNSTVGFRCVKDAR